MTLDCFAYYSAIFHAIDWNSGSYESSESVEPENHWVFPKTIDLNRVSAKTKKGLHEKNRFWTNFFDLALTFFFFDKKMKTQRFFISESNGEFFETPT